MAKKSFAPTMAMQAAARDVTRVQEASNAEWRVFNIRIDSIQPDPKNPRCEGKITLEECVQGVKEEDPKYEEKNCYRESIIQFASNIAHHGVLDPIKVYSIGSDKYILLDGERRFFASYYNLYTKKEPEDALLKIPALIFKSKPTDVRTRQWAYHLREGLNLYETVGHIQAIVAEQAQLTGKKITAQMLATVLGKSPELARLYLNVVNAGDSIHAEIQNGTIRDIKTANWVSTLEDDQRKAAFQYLRDGLKKENIQQIFKNISQENPVAHLEASQADLQNASTDLGDEPIETEVASGVESEPELDETTMRSEPPALEASGSSDSQPVDRPSFGQTAHQAGRPAKAIHLGSTQNAEVAKHIIYRIVDKRSYPALDEVDWNNFSAVKRLFKQILNELEVKLSSNSHLD